jgi:sugar lactone lactonase YvrE
MFAPVVDARCHPGAIISEGKVDRSGRLVGVSGDRRFHEPLGAIHRWERDGSVRLLDDRIVLGNSLCWSLDGTVMYTADSMRSVIYAYDYGETFGLSSHSLPLRRVDAFPQWRDRGCRGPPVGCFCTARDGSFGWPRTAPS